MDFGFYRAQRQAERFRDLFVRHFLRRRQAAPCDPLPAVAADRASLAPVRRAARRTRAAPAGDRQSPRPAPSAARCAAVPGGSNSARLPAGTPSPWTAGFRLAHSRRARTSPKRCPPHPLDSHSGRKRNGTRPAHISGRAPQSHSFSVHREYPGRQVKFQGREKKIKGKMEAIQLSHRSLHGSEVPPRSSKYARFSPRGICHLTSHLLE